MNFFVYFRDAMAKKSENTSSVCNRIISDARRGEFKPVYLLMGEEPYYPDLVCNEIQKCCIPEEDKDFNETVCYGSETDAAQVISFARRYPMMADRQLIIVREAQSMAKLDSLAIYCQDPLESTVLVLLLRGARIDRRSALYKAVEKIGAIVDSPAVRDYEIEEWIASYYASRGLVITPPAAELLAEHAGTDLSRLATETDKLLRNLPEGAKNVTEEDVEKNVGFSREYSIFELSRELSAGRAAKALKIACAIGTAARFSMPAATAMLYSNFSRILRYGAMLQSNPNPGPEMKARALSGVNPYFYREYDRAARLYPPAKCMEIISLLCEYDYFSKGGSPVPQDQLFVELVSKILRA